MRALGLLSLATLASVIPIGAGAFGGKPAPAAARRLPPPSGAAAAPKVEFTRDIQPILKAHCIQCHGGAQKQGGLLLDSREAVLKGGVSGASFVPGKSAG
ncbi:MAG: Planctomycete cytochrome, partial [Armatimonadetes bacterium]|nr:Planctomycete cytochrome [Armatimonadota bacterium]